MEHFGFVNLDAKALGQRLAGRGAAMREVVPGTAYFITDPEGNAIELYTPPKPSGALRAARATKRRGPH